jgi:uncharacterized coiled-coil protein SlyX
LKDRLNKLEERITHLESRTSEDEKAIIVNNQLLNSYKKSVDDDFSQLSFLLSRNFPMTNLRK